ncbi:MAG: hypothetical protein H6595_03005 [Flavobacteriales bacterium]|nr:hypothetical protein [Flavobacteriales bacterium]MCB9166426.1 hypothetical protein [Flavobacteriales bacterium]
MAMINGFRSTGDGRTVSLVAHVRDILHEDPTTEVLVGTDSHNRADHTIYITTVVLRFRQNGAQVIYRKDRAERITDLWTRLWGEVERSIAVAEHLSHDGGVHVERIDLDLNSDPRYASHRIYQAAVGYVRAQGYDTRTKPDMVIASWAANALCNGWGRTHETPTGLSPRQG